MTYEVHPGAPRVDSVGLPPSDPTSSSIASLLIARVGDEHLGLRTHAADWTWGQVVAESARRGHLARALQEPGPFHVGVLLDNDAEFIFWLGGAALTGATIVGINPTRDDQTLAGEIRLTDCQLIITDTAGAARLERLDLAMASDRILDVTSPHYAAVLASTPDDVALHAVPSAETIMLLLFTSGTTGASKAVRCSQKRLVTVAQKAVSKFGHHRNDVDYCCMPLYHGNALMALWAPALVVGATVCLVPKFSAKTFVADIRHFRCTYFTYVGKAIAYILATPATDDDQDNCLTRGFGTEASPNDRLLFERRFGAPLLEGYGSSEGGAVVTPDPAAPPAALGRPAHADIVIIDPESLVECAPAALDPSGRLQNPDQAVGEIVDRTGSPGFEGYYANDLAGAERTKNGWFWSGDLGYVDSAGFLYFAGRRGDWVRVDGENTSTLVTERSLQKFPGVLAAAAYAVPDPVSGDQLMAALEMDHPDRLDPDDLADFLTNQHDLGSKGIPRLIRVSTRLPATGSNKILKRELQRQRWDVDEPIYHWKGRTPARYLPMTARDKLELVRRFTDAGRQNLLTL
ncbi:MAG: AMP-binding protein [Nocardioides sp.]